MADIDSRFIAFENDHTYLKTSSKDCKNLQSLENRSIKITEVRATPPIDSLCDKTKNKTNVIDMNQYSLSQAIDILSGPNSKVFFLPPVAPSSVPVAPNVVSLKNRMPVYKETKRVEKCILPKASTPIKVMPATNPNNLLYFIPPTTPLNVGFQNTRKSTTGKPISAVPRIEKVGVQPAQGRKVMKDNNSGICKIKLSNKLMKRIQNGEKLFMCLECDKIYLEHWRLLEHQKTHTKCEKNDVKERIVFVERKKNPEEQEEENSYDYRRDDDFFDNHSANPSTIPKKPKMFKGECIICHSVFLDLGKHLETFHQNDLIKNSSHQCFKCDLQFDNEHDLQMHKLTVHRNGNVYSCENCLKEFSSEKDLEVHMLTHNTDNMKYLCPYCDAGFSLSVGLRAHLTKHIGNSAEKPTFESSPPHHVEKSLGRPAEQLDQLFADLDNISDNVNGVYVEQVANDNYRVRFVKNDSDNNKQSLNEFIESDTNNDNTITNNNMPLETIENNMELQPQLTSNGRKKRVSYTVCRICLMIVSYSRIGRHMRKKHNSAAPYQCEICHADFNRKHLMDDHRRKHTNNKPHKCSECNKCFAYKHHRNRHMMLVHNSDTLDKPFKCTMCDKSFSFKEYLTLHINSRHTGKRYMCQICGKSFPTNAGLNKHQLCHTDERPFMCEQCGRTFKCKTHCDTHKKNIHPGDVDLSVEQEKFECNLCNKTFTTKVYRDMHFKRHNGQGHQCSICFKLFVSKAHMQRHIKIMH